MKRKITLALTDLWRKCLKVCQIQRLKSRTSQISLARRRMVIVHDAYRISARGAKQTGMLQHICIVFVDKAKHCTRKFTKKFATVYCPTCDLDLVWGKFWYKSFKNKFLGVTGFRCSNFFLRIVVFHIHVKNPYLYLQNRWVFLHHWYRVSGNLSGA